MIGLGVMLNELFRDSGSSVVVQNAIGKTIRVAYIDNEYNVGDGGLFVGFDDGYGIVLFDDGRSCCESRYIHSDDDLTSFKGAKLINVEIKSAPNVSDEDSWGDHEVQFLVLQTDRGTMTIETHNKHNGFYGGFYVKALEAQIP